MASLNTNSKTRKYYYFHFIDEKTVTKRASDLAMVTLLVK